MMPHAELLALLSARSRQAASNGLGVSPAAPQRDQASRKRPMLATDVAIADVSKRLCVELQPPWKRPVCPLQQQEKQQDESHQQQQQPGYQWQGEEREEDWKPYWEEWKRQVQQQQQQLQKQNQQDQQQQLQQKQKQEQEQEKWNQQQQQQQHEKEVQRQQLAFLHEQLEAMRAEIPRLPFDGYMWLKYGEKSVGGNRHVVRCYFKCKRSKQPCSNPCPAKKQVVFDFRTGSLTHITKHLNDHNHSPLPCIGSRPVLDYGHSKSGTTSKGAVCECNVKNLTTPSSAHERQESLHVRKSSLLMAAPLRATRLHDLLKLPQSASITQDCALASVPKNVGQHEGRRGNVAMVDRPLSALEGSRLTSHRLQEPTLPMLPVSHPAVARNGRQWDRMRQGVMQPDLCTFQRCDQKQQAQPQMPQQQRLQLHETTSLLQKQQQLLQNFEQQKQKQCFQQQEEKQQQETHQLHLQSLLQLHERRLSSLLEVEKKVQEALQQQLLVGQGSGAGSHAPGLNSWVDLLEQNANESDATTDVPADLVHDKLPSQMNMERAPESLAAGPSDLELPSFGVVELCEGGLSTHKGMDGQPETNKSPKTEGDTDFLLNCGVLASIAPTSRQLTTSVCSDSGETLEAVVQQALQKSSMYSCLDAVLWHHQ